MTKQIDGYIPVKDIHSDLMDYIGETEIEIIDDEEYISSKIIDLASRVWKEEKGMMDSFEAITLNEFLEDDPSYWEEEEY